MVAGGAKDRRADLARRERDEAGLELLRQIALVQPAEVSAEMLAHHCAEARLIADAASRLFGRIADLSDLNDASARGEGEEDMARAETEALVRLARARLIFSPDVTLGDIHSGADALVHHLHMEELIAEVFAVLRLGEALLVDGLPELTGGEVVLLDDVLNGGLDLLVRDADLITRRRLADQLFVHQLLNELGVDRLAALIAP